MISPEKIEAIRKLMAEASVYEDDLEESFIMGGGPGGQKTNKTSSVVRLSHGPTILENAHKRKSAARQKAEKIRRQKRRRSRRQKQKMLADKHAHSEIKAMRKKVEVE